MNTLNFLLRTARTTLKSTDHALKSPVRSLFIGKPKQKSNLALYGASSAVATAIVAANAYQEDTKTITSKQAALALYRYVNYRVGLDDAELYKKADKLALYDHYSQDSAAFFRGEYLSQALVDDMNAHLGQRQVLSRNMSITTSQTIAEGFTNPDSIAKFTEFFGQPKKIPVLYQIIIPDDVKFIKIPEDYSQIEETTLQPFFRESEYVIPMGTHIRITKSELPQEENNKHQLIYKIHILSDQNIDED